LKLEKLNDFYTLQDAFQLQARTSNGVESKIVTCNVTVVPDNDQPPEMANNTGLQVCSMLQEF